MKRTALTVCALSVAALAGTASADLAAESIGQQNYAGMRSIDIHGNSIAAPRGATTVFTNLQAGFAANAAFSSTDLTAVFGDQLATVGTGRLQEFSFTLFNSGTSAGALTSAQVAINFYRASDSSLIGGFNVNTGAINLNTGFFTTLNVTDLDGLDINLDTTDIIVTQSVLSLVGAANRLGLVSANPVTIGTSVPQLYIDASTTGGGVAGFYNITSGGAPISFNAGYQVAVPAPASAAMLGLGGLFAARRRR
jgi:hypothetical protein